MFAYILKRFLLMFPTLLGVLLLTFVVVQFVPGGPVEQYMAEAKAGMAGGGGAEGAARCRGTRAEGGVGTRTSPERELGGFAAPDRARKRGKRVQERLRPLARGTGHRAERAGSSGGRGRRRAGTQFVGDSEPRARARRARVGA